MKRYDMVDDDKWITEVSDGDYILFTDHEAAIKALEQELLNYQAVTLQEGAEKAAEVIRQTEREACAGIVRTNMVMRGSLNEALHAIRQRGEE